MPRTFQSMSSELVSKYKPRVLALDLSRVPDLEYSALQMLVEGEKRAMEHGATIWLAGLDPGVLEVVRKPGWTSGSAGIG